MSAEVSKAQGSSSEEAIQANDNGKPESEASEIPEWRSPSASVAQNPNAASLEPRKFGVGNKVWVYRDGDGWVPAKVDSFESVGNNWGYYLKGENGKVLWSNRVKLFNQEELSWDKDSD